MTRRYADYLKLVVRSLPVLSGYTSVGIAFGLVAVGAGITPRMAILMSLVVYAGALQFVAVPWIAGGLHPGLMFVGAVLINARQILYGLSLGEHFRSNRRGRLYRLFALTDETFAVLAGTADEPWIAHEWAPLVLSALHHLYWIGGTAAGAWLGARIESLPAGLSFALTALFFSLFLDACERADRRPAALLGFAISACCLVLGKRWFLPASMVLIVAASWIIAPHRAREDA